jgi:tRNA(Arg) A34 adenosine deaminase TadA
MDKHLDKFMSETIKLAGTNALAPYAAILVYDNKDILFKSVNTAHVNPLMHGELSVIHKLFQHGFDGKRSQLSLYTTAEPCPMCAGAIYWAMIPKVIYGSSIPFLQQLFGGQIQIRAEEVLSKTPASYQCHLIGGVMQEECNQLFVEAKRLRDLSD